MPADARFAYLSQDNVKVLQELLAAADSGRGLRDAVDYVCGLRITAGGQSVEADAGLFAELAAVSRALGSTLVGHFRLRAYLLTQPQSVGRSAVLGDIERGHMLGWADEVADWSAVDAEPGDPAIARRFRGSLVIRAFPELYDTIAASVTGTGDRYLAAVPVYREGVSWEQHAPGTGGGARWLVQLDQAVLYPTELIPVTADLETHDSWQAFAEVPIPEPLSSRS